MQVWLKTPMIPSDPLVIFYIPAVLSACAVSDVARRLPLTWNAPALHQPIDQSITSMRQARQSALVPSHEMSLQPPTSLPRRPLLHSCNALAYPKSINPTRLKLRALYRWLIPGCIDLTSVARESLNRTLTSFTKRLLILLWNMKASRRVPSSFNTSPAHPYQISRYIVL